VCVLLCLCMLVCITLWWRCLVSTRCSACAFLRCSNKRGCAALSGCAYVWNVSHKHGHTPAQCMSNVCVSNTLFHSKEPCIMCVSNTLFHSKELVETCGKRWWRPATPSSTQPQGREMQSRPRPRPRSWCWCQKRSCSRWACVRVDCFKCVRICAIVWACVRVDCFKCVCVCAIMLMSTNWPSTKPK